MWSTVFLSGLALLAFVLSGGVPEQLSRTHTPVVALFELYGLGCPALGMFVGLCRPLLRSAVGCAAVGSVVLTAFIAGVFLIQGHPLVEDASAILVLGVMTGALCGLSAHWRSRHGWGPG